MKQEKIFILPPPFLVGIIFYGSSAGRSCPRSILGPTTTISSSGSEFSLNGSMVWRIWFSLATQLTQSIVSRHLTDQLTALSEIKKNLPVFFKFACLTCVINCLSLSISLAHGSSAFTLTNGWISHVFNSACWRFSSVIH